MEMIFKITCEGKSHIFSFKFYCEYYDVLSYNIATYKVSRLTALFATDMI